MSGWSKFGHSMRLGAVAAAVAAIGLTVLMAPPARADVSVGFGFGYPGPYYGGPFYGYPPPPPAYYYPPPTYYYPPPAAYYAPPAASAPPPAASAAPATPAESAVISYTNQPAFRNRAGEECRHYRSTRVVGGRDTTVYGTACRGADGQWRVAK